MTSLSLPQPLRGNLGWTFDVRMRPSARVLAALVMGLLAVGVSLSILTTPDHSWWRLHFSELGTFPDFSGRVFNGTLVAAGGLIIAFGVRVHRDLKALQAVRTVRGSRVLIALIMSVGVNLGAVGCVPVNTNTFVHDRAASGIMASFLAILVMTVIRRRHVPVRLLRATLLVLTSLGIMIGVFIAGLVNLAALEFVGFSLIFTWIGVFTACLHRAVVQLDQAQPAPADSVRRGASAERRVASTPVAAHRRRRRLAASSRTRMLVPWAGRYRSMPRGPAQPARPGRDIRTARPPGGSRARRALAVPPRRTPSARERRAQAPVRR